MSKSIPQIAEEARIEYKYRPVATGTWQDAIEAQAAAIKAVLDAPIEAWDRTITLRRIIEVYAGNETGAKIISALTGDP